MNDYLYQLEALSCFYGDRVALTIEKLNIRKGEILGLIGPNGSGKSTLLKTLAFLLPFQGGLLFNGLLGQERSEVAFLPQDPFLLKRSVYDNVAYGLQVRGWKGDRERRVRESLDRVGLAWTFASRWWNELSGGEAQRAALAARLALRPRALLLDEPTASVDERSEELIRTAILGSKEEWNTTLVIASHDFMWLDKVAEDVVMLVNGNIIGHDQMNILNEKSGKLAILAPSDIFFEAPHQEINAGGEAFSSVEGRVVQVGYQERKKSYMVLMDCGYPLRVRLPAESQAWDTLRLGEMVRAFFAPSALKWIDQKDNHGNGV